MYNDSLRVNNQNELSLNEEYQKIIQKMKVIR